MVDILRHELVPKHELLSDHDAQELLQRYAIAPEQLPKILFKDPCTKALGAKPGQIIKITRRSPTAGIATAYRLVVEG